MSESREHDLAAEYLMLQRPSGVVRGKSIVRGQIIKREFKRRGMAE